ncbi:MULTISPECIES: vitamin K epoxide reductase family protein [unclassified Nocardiopsis]|uniref:vitamin K epoxide reductase family protein n=1 Tax=unclassified Nocardiopsis TaxID=2649073 RepID=UPI0019152F54|nr:MULTISPECIES: vitamin K epoxide reductase family protein [unclassified Nocardiopsis]
MSDALRLGTAPFVRARRRVAALALTASGAYTVVALYQFGLLRRVPEPRLPGLDADRVDASGEAYGVLTTPDAALGMVSSALTLLLAGMGGEDRARDRRWIPLALAGKAAADAVVSLILFAEQVSRHRRVCSWCTLAAIANLAMVPASLPEARAALARHRASAPGSHTDQERLP